jgi:menaquinone-dependent protoporphyrinogen oxidase
MNILVAYSTKYGATKGLAEHIAGQLRAAGHLATVQPVNAAGELAGYDAYLIGSAVYIGHWQKEATAFVRHNRVTLARKPVWLFSSGPLGTDAVNAEGNDVRAAAGPKELAELMGAVNAREHRVFFGVLDPDKLGFRDRTIRALPAGRALLPEGDFRDWPEIDAWAGHIAQALANVPASVG